MNLRGLSLNEMVNVTGGLLEGDRLETIRAHKLLAPHEGELRDAHKAVVAVRPPEGASAEMLALSAEAADVDDAHDRGVRGGYGLLSLAAIVVEDEDTATRMEELKDKLYPDGSALVNLSYGAEAGAARRLETELKRPLRAELSRIQLVVGDYRVTALELAQAQVLNGRKLGRLEARKEVLEVELNAERGEDGTETEKSGNATNRARLDWIQTVALFIDTVARTKSLSATDRKTLLAGVEKVVKAANARGRSAMEAPAKKVEPEKKDG